MFDEIRDSKVLITGASGGIGSAMAKLFGNHGALVGIHYCDSRAEAEAVLADIKADAGRAAVFQADLLEPGDRDRLVDDFAGTFGGLDVLINNAGGIVGHRPYLELDPDSWQRTFSLNVEAPFFLAQKAFPLMRQAGGGRIINISSIAAKYGGSDIAVHYGAAKAALENVTVALARRGATDNILVNTIRPGVIDTGFHGKFPKAGFEARIKMIPVGRMGTPSEVARLALFLASEGGSYITGQILSVSGGE